MTHLLDLLWAPCAKPHGRILIALKAINILNDGGVKDKAEEDGRRNLRNVQISLQNGSASRS